MTISCAVLMCHAPIVIPQIAGQRAADCAASTSAMQATASHLLGHQPDALVVISPHAPRDRTRFGVVDADELVGDFGRFGASHVGLRLPGAPRAASALRQSAREQGLELWSVPGAPLDHGALVPLHFVSKAGWHGPTLLLALPYPGTRSEAEMGRALAAAAQACGERWCVLASGDMSHRLTRDAPAGYHPEAREFDARFRSLIEHGELARACALDAGLRDIAAEDVVDSCTVAAAAVGFSAAGHHALCYEAPFGVGYFEAILYDGASHAAQRKPGASAPTPLRVARAALQAQLRFEPYTPPTLPPPYDYPRGVFVTLRKHGELRGCIGHIEPQHNHLGAEIASCAVSAALQDPRFPPVGLDELDELAIELSLLSPCEPVAHIDALDPSRYGVVVSAGQRRGVLLPDVSGVGSVDAQLQIAMRKAGLSGDEELQIERFEVVKLCEAPSPSVPATHTRSPGPNGLH